MSQRKKNQELSKTFKMYNYSRYFWEFWANLHGTIERVQCRLVYLQPHEAQSY